jgi:hypothetical protein
MVRRVVTGLSGVAIALIGVVAVASTVSASVTTISLNLPQSVAFSLLGYSCGGIGEQAYASGFDPTSGFPTGDVYLSTTCSSGGRGSHPSTHTAWAGVTWDFTGEVVSDAPLTSAPSVDPAFSAFDANGNEIYNASKSAYLTYGPSFVPIPRVTGISTTAGPTSGGTSVTITGTGFTAATAVNFGPTAIAATGITIASDNSITVSSPSEDAGAVYVTVSSAGGTSATASNLQFTYVAPPTVTGLSPNHGGINGGTSVTITGTNLSTVTMVKFGDTAAGFTPSNDSSITAISPGEGSPDAVDVTVVTIGGTSTISSADVFTYGSGGCSSTCAASVHCAKLTGTATGRMTISQCTPKSATNKSATSVALGDTLTWNNSGQTTVESPIATTSPGRGACAARATEEVVTGAVTGGTSTYVAVGDPVSASICVTPSGKLSLVKGTTFSL